MNDESGGAAERARREMHKLIGRRTLQQTRRRPRARSSFIVHRSSFILFFLLALGGCTRERREFRQPPQGSRAEPLAQSELMPGAPVPTPPTKNPVEENAYALNEGKRLFQQYNCAGCHANGGGGMGPPLMDDKWLYGSDPANIFQTILEGRPNGMPSFRQKIPDTQVWQLVGYVRSLSGQLPKDVSPTRDDHMSAHPSEQRTQQRGPVNSGVSKSEEMPQ